MSANGSRWLVIGCSVLALGDTVAWGQSIQTIAGLVGSEDGRPATLSAIVPAGVAVDAAGNVFVAETSTNRIRRIDARTGVVTTVAGTGNSGFSGDGGPASQATLFAPAAVLLDAGGNLIVADASNSRIRRIDATSGVITTIAGDGGTGATGDGGPATAAQIGVPRRLALDGGGNLYFSEQANRRVRRVAAGSGIITTVAGASGNPSANDDGQPAVSTPLNYPAGIALDGAGNLYIADMGTQRVRFVSASTGQITTLAGAHNLRGFSGDGGPAADARLSQPSDLALSPAGDVLIADAGNSRVRRIRGGVITTVAGNGLRGSGGDGGPATLAALGRPNSLALLADGSLMIADSSEYRVRRVTGSGVISTVGGRGNGDGGPATAAVLAPLAVAVDAAGDVLISDAGTLGIRRVSRGTGLITTIAGNGQQGFAGDGGPATLASFDDVGPLAVDAAGNIFVADRAASRIRRIDAVTGVIATVAGDGQLRYGGDGGPATLGSFRSISALALDAAGALYVPDLGSRIVRKVGGGFISTIAGQPERLGFSGDGGPATLALMVAPSSVAVDRAGNIFIGDNGVHRVRQVLAQNGYMFSVAGTGFYPGAVGGYSGDGGPAGAAQLFTPNSLATDAAGNLFISDIGNSRIRRIDARTGLIATVAGNGKSGNAGDGGPATAASIFGGSIAADAAGTLYIADGGSRRIRVVAPCVTVTAPALAAPAAGAAGVSTSPLLSWSPVPGAFRYDVYLGIGTAPVLAAQDLTTTSFVASNLTPGASYSWRVVAKGDPFCTPASNATSETRAFATAGGCQTPGAFEPTAPADGATGVAGPSVAFSWAAAAGAATYDVYLGPDNPPPLLASGVSATSYTASGLVAGGTYFWNVLAHAACDPTRTRATAVRSFGVGGACSPPGAFGLSSPAAGATVPAATTLSWAASPNASSYDLYLGTGAAPALYLSGLTRTSTPVTGLAAGATYSWRVVARTSCDGALTASSALLSFTVAGTCDAPATPTITLLPPGNVGTGQTYVIAWSSVGLDAGGAYVVERSLSPGFTPLLDSQTTASTSASFVAVGQGRIYHRVRALPGCDPGRPSADSDGRSVTVVAGSPNVVFTVQPSAIVTALSEKLSDVSTSFTLENISGAPVQLLLGRQEIASVPFFFISDPAGGDAAFVTLEPRRPKTFEVRFSGPPEDRVGSYQGLIFATSTGPGLSITPYAFVNLKVGGSDTATPELRVSGVPAEYTFFPGFAGDDAARPPIEVEIRNPGGAPMELAAEIGPEVWLVPESGWNAAPIEPGGVRTVRLATRRTRAPNGSALPRYTYFTVRTRSGQTARLLVQDNDAPPLSEGRASLPERGVRTYLIPSVVKAGSRIGNTFVSKVRLTNSGTEALQADLFFTPNGADGFDAARVRRATVVIPPNDLVNLTDPLVQLFGLAPPIAGTLEVRTAPEKAGLLTVTSAVDAPARSGGTFGFQMPTAQRGEGARAGSPHFLSGITASPGYRTNLILAETTGIDTAAVRATLFDREGLELGSAVHTVPRYGQVQLSGVVAQLGGGESLSAGRLELTVEAGGGSVVGLVTVIDNSNDDAVTYVSRPVNPEPLAALRARLTRSPLAGGPQKYLVPAVVNGFSTFPGTAQPYTFRSLLGFTAGTLAPVTFRLTYVDLQTGEQHQRTVTLEGRKTREYENVIEQLFGLPEGARSQGPIYVEIEGNGLMYCKVYSNLEAGTLGDGFPVVAIPAETLTGPASQKPLYLDGLEQSVDRSRGTRSNLILNEVLGEPVTVTVRLYEAGNRSAPIAERDFELRPLEKLQLSTVFAGLGLESDAFDSARRKDRTNVLCVVTPKGGSGMVSATVTTIDNKTGDTKNALLTPNGGVSATGGGSIGF